MEINKFSKVGDLLKQYPFLKEELAKVTDKASLLDNPLTRAVISKMNLEEVSKKAGIDVDTIISKVIEVIQSH